VGCYRGHACHETSAFASLNSGSTKCGDKDKGRIANCLCEFKVFRKQISFTDRDAACLAIEKVSGGRVPEYYVVDI
jgi:hypothetical protein